MFTRSLYLFIYIQLEACSLSTGMTVLLAIIMDSGSPPANTVLPRLFGSIVVQLNGLSIKWDETNLR